MKKVLTAVFASALVLASCGKTDNNSNNGNFSQEEKALGDSLSLTFGQMQGAQALSNFERMKPMMNEQQLANFKKDEFIKGLELVLSTDTANLAFLNGVQQGLQMYGIFMDRNLGVPVDAKAIIKGFADVYNTDSIDQAASAKYSVEFQGILDKVQTKAQEKAEAEALESQEAKDNIAAGEKYAAERVAEGFQKSESGLVYKITNEGEGDKVGENDIVNVTYVGKHINGEEFDRSMGDTPARMSAANVVKGFQEGLTKLGKGGSAILVIPGELGYGAMGRGPIGKMETLVFEITVDGIEGK